MSRKNVRIKDIARLAGVSAGTVDRVLHNRGRVSEVALKKVMAVLDQIDYKPNLIARTLGSNKTYRIAALVPNPEQDPYWAQSWAGILQARVEWAHYGVSVESFLFDVYDKNSFKTVAQAVYDATPHGVLLAPIFYHEALPFFDLFRSGGIPFVFFNTNIPEMHPLSFIGQNLYQSGRVGAELMHFGLHGQCHFVVLHIGEDIHNSIHLSEKEKGFRDYMEEKDKEGIKVTTLNLSNPADPLFEKQIIALLSEPQLKGIFVSTSKGTFIVASILECNLRNGVRLIGYDLLEESVRYMRSGTIDFLINQNPKRQSFLGISHLANKLLFRKETPRNDLFPLEIITQQNFESYLTSGIH